MSVSLENRKRKRVNRLGKCDVCRVVDALYTCPRCEAVTCSLNCVKRHKKDLDCDGIRVRSKYIPADKLNETNLLSDYRLLEDVSTCVEADEEAEVTLGGTNKEMPTREALTKAAFIRGVHMSYLPEKFEKHSENTSYFLSKEDCIYWRLKLSFLHANFHTLSIKKCAETMMLGDVVKGCLLRSEEFWGKQASDDPLEVYREVDFSNISVLMTADKLPNNQKKFYILDMSKSLRENFVGKCIVEFPQLCIAIEDCHVVSSVQENFVTNFFGERDFESEEEEQPTDGFENDMKKEGKRRKRDSERKKPRHRNEDSDRESGELTDSSDSEDSSSDTDQSSDELFKESEFRSIYKDLLSTFESDLNHLPKK